MGRYVDEILQPDEKLLYSTNPLVLLFAGDRRPGSWPPRCRAVAAIAIGQQFRQAVADGAGGVFGDWHHRGGPEAWFRRYTTEFDVTDKRVIYKTGFIQRRTIEMNMDKIESVDINQSLLGRVFDFGEVTIRGVGESWEPIFHHRLAAQIPQLHHGTR